MWGERDLCPSVFRDISVGLLLSSHLLPWWHSCASRALCSFCSTSQESLGDGINSHLIKFVHWKLFCFARNPQLQRDSTTWWLCWSTGWFPHLSVRLVQVKIIRLAAFCLPKVMSGRLAVTRNGGRKSFHVVNACREDLLALEICRLDSLPVSVHQCWCDLRWYWLKIITVWQFLYSEISGEFPVDSCPFHKAIITIIINRNSAGILYASK